LKRKYPRGNRISSACFVALQTLQAEINFSQSITKPGQGVISALQNILGGIEPRVKAVLLTGMPICVRALSSSSYTRRNAGELWEECRVVASFPFGDQLQAWQLIPRALVATPECRNQGRTLVSGSC
jgi:hypothetical protein